jgi:hypothetical protein
MTCWLEWRRSRNETEARVILREKKQTGAVAILLSRQKHISIPILSESQSPQKATPRKGTAERPVPHLQRPGGEEAFAKSWAARNPCAAHGIAQWMMGERLDWRTVISAAPSRSHRGIRNGSTAPSERYATSPPHTPAAFRVAEKKSMRMTMSTSHPCGCGGRGTQEWQPRPSPERGARWGPGSTRSRPVTGAAAHLQFCHSKSLSAHLPSVLG